MIIGLIGAGRFGSEWARLAVSCGHEVIVSNSRGPESLLELVTALGANAQASSVEEAAYGGDVVVLTLPISHYRTVPVQPLAGKVVLDCCNYYPQKHGPIVELDHESITSSELLQAHLPTSRVVKGFNHIRALEIMTDGSPAGNEKRRALAIAGDNVEAKQTVRQLLDELGFDSVDAGPLREGWRFQRGSSIYARDARQGGLRHTAVQLRASLEAATTPADHS